MKVSVITHGIQTASQVDLALLNSDFQPVSLLTDLPCLSLSSLFQAPSPSWGSFCATPQPLKLLTNRNQLVNYVFLRANPVLVRRCEWRECRQAEWVVRPLGPLICIWKVCLVPQRQGPFSDTQNCINLHFYSRFVSTEADRPRAHLSSHLLQWRKVVVASFDIDALNSDCIYSKYN